MIIKRCFTPLFHFENNSIIQQNQRKNSYIIIRRRIKLFLTGFHSTLLRVPVIISPLSCLIFYFDCRVNYNTIKILSNIPHFIQHLLSFSLPTIAQHKHRVLKQFHRFFFSLINNTLICFSCSDIIFHFLF